MEICKKHDNYGPFPCSGCEIDRKNDLLERLLDQLKMCGACNGFGRDMKWDTQCSRCYGFGFILYKQRQKFKDLVAEIKSEVNT